MTWNELENGALGLMFSNVSGSTPVTTADSSVAEYVLNMPDAAMFAFADLSSVCPFMKTVTVSPAANTLHLKEICPDFIRLSESELYTTDSDGTREPFTDYILFTDGDLYLKSVPENPLTLSFVCYPAVLTKDTPGETLIDYPVKALHAAMYYMAHRLYLEDDVSIATQYINMYYAIKEELKAEYAARPAGFDEYVNKAGWL